MTANNKQVGGTHYKTEGSMQHWDIVYECLEGDYLLGNATKYIFRCGKKGGRTKAIEDLQKVINTNMEIDMRRYREMLTISIHGR